MTSFNNFFPHFSFGFPVILTKDLIRWYSHYKLKHFGERYKKKKKEETSLLSGNGIHDWWKIKTACVLPLHEVKSKNISTPRNLCWVYLGASFSHIPNAHAYVMWFDRFMQSKFTKYSLNFSPHPTNFYNPGKCPNSSMSISFHFLSFLQFYYNPSKSNYS